MKKFLTIGALCTLALFITTGLFAAQETTSWAKAEAAKIIQKPIFKDVRAQGPKAVKQKEAEIAKLLLDISKIIDKGAWTPHNLKEIEDVKTLIFGYDPQTQTGGINWKNGGILPPYDPADKNNQEVLINQLGDEIIDIAAHPGFAGTPAMNVIPDIMDDIMAIFDLPKTDLYNKIHDIIAEFGQGSFSIDYFCGSAGGIRHQDAWERLIENPVKMVLGRNNCFGRKGAGKAAEALSKIEGALDNCESSELQAPAGNANGLLNFRAAPWITDMFEAFLKTDIIQNPSAIKYLEYAHAVLILTLGEEPETQS